MNKLKFIGTGNFNNYLLGNNSAYFIEGDSLFLFDCGCDVFDKIHRYFDTEFKRVKNIYVMISHVHDDHVGSLTSLIFHSYYYYKKRVIIINNKQKDLMSLIKKMTGNYSKFNTIKNADVHGWLSVQTSNSIVDIKFIDTHHVPYMKSYGFLLKIHREEHDETFYYSGDSNYIPKFILTLLKNDQLDIIYQDTASMVYDNNPHLSLKLLKELIPYECRNKVYCMHMDLDFNEREALKAGFNLAEV